VKLVSELEGFLTPTAHILEDEKLHHVMQPHALKIDLYLDQGRFAKRQLMKFVCDSEGFLMPNVYSLLPS
jgi:hypothetical protein